jgi:hypothetical protein
MTCYLRKFSYFSISIIYIVMYFQLSKSQKKIARRVMDKGLDFHYIKALKDAESILINWLSGAYRNNTEAYMNLFNSIDRNDNKIAAIYNDKGGSRWVEIMALQLADGVITIDDLKDFEPEVIEAIISISKY